MGQNIVDLASVIVSTVICILLFGMILCGVYMFLVRPLIPAGATILCSMLFLVAVGIPLVTVSIISPYAGAIIIISAFFSLRRMDNLACQKIPGGTQSRQAYYGRTSRQGTLIPARSIARRRRDRARPRFARGAASISIGIDYDRFELGGTRAPARARGALGWSGRTKVRRGTSMDSSRHSRRGAGDFSISGPIRDGLSRRRRAAPYCRYEPPGLGIRTKKSRREERLEGESASASDEGFR